MWILWHLETGLNNESIGSRNIVIKPGRSWTIGRKDCDLIIKNDLTVSKKHATIEIRHHGTENVTFSQFILKECLFLVDLSTQGTFYNGQKIQSFELHSGHLLKFGNHKSIYRIERIQMTFCPTNLSESEKQHAKTMIQELGLTMVDKWNSSCTHLITNEMKISLKIVLAVAHGRYIVSTEFLKALLDQNVSHFRMPLESDHVPIQKQQLSVPIKVEPIQSRKMLFQNIQFLTLLEKQKTQVEPIIHAVGGVIWLETLSTLESKVKSLKGRISLLSDGSSKLKEMAKKLKLRFVTENDLAVSILANNASLIDSRSTETWCKTSDTVVKPSEFIMGTQAVEAISPIDTEEDDGYSTQEFDPVKKAPLLKTALEDDEDDLFLPFDQFKSKQSKTCSIPTIPQKASLKSTNNSVAQFDDILDDLFDTTEAVMTQPKKSQKKITPTLLSDDDIISAFKPKTASKILVPLSDDDIIPEFKPKNKSKEMEDRPSKRVGEDIVGSLNKKQKIREKSPEIEVKQEKLASPIPVKVEKESVIEIPSSPIIPVKKERLPSPVNSVKLERLPSPQIQVKAEALTKDNPELPLEHDSQEIGRMTHEFADLVVHSIIVPQTSVDYGNVPNFKRFKKKTPLPITQPEYETVVHVNDHIDRSDWWQDAAPPKRSAPITSAPKKKQKTIQESIASSVDDIVWADFVE